MDPVFKGPISKGREGKERGAGEVKDVGKERLRAFYILISLINNNSSQITSIRPVPVVTRKSSQIKPNL